MRDLTSNVRTPDLSSGDEQQRPLNPFEDDGAASYESPRDSPHSSDNENSHYGKPFNAYNGYYSQNGTSANLLSSQNSNDQELSRPGSTNNLHVPPEYDRYPSMAGSRVVSSTSLNHLSQSFQQSPQQEKLMDESSSSSNRSTNPFIAATDFSPFGGYPASSFPLHVDEKEPDDYLHNPDPIADAEYDKNRFWHDLKNIDKRSLGGLIGLIVLFLGAMVVFILLPVFFYSGAAYRGAPVSYEVLSNYQYPILSAVRKNLIDPDTPSSAFSITSQGGEKWNLVFSDEFNAEGRTFYEGDDQFFTAPDIHYDATNDLEWYDPDAVSTGNGTLNLRMDAFKNHNLFYRSGMVQSWNKLCFTQGKLDISARLPNYGNITGLWPGLWSMGNLGRPGYLASTEGVWPYSYDSCDAGITPNQSSPDGISYLPGQKLNTCTCKGEDHPNPGVGRGAPEIDVIEAEVGNRTPDEMLGIASQSLQVAPYDIWYMPDYSWIKIHNASVTTMNTYAGGPFQQAVSGTTVLNITWYEYGDGQNFQRYGYEYLNDDKTGYLTWFVGEDPTLTITPQSLYANGNIGNRPITKEPMSIIMNFGISNSWAYINWPALTFPLVFSIDFVRIYQPPNQVSLTCDPADFPTYDYIQSHLDAYQNVNLTSWKNAGYDWPKNKLTGKCS
ncbi:beta-glucan synthesis-associated protein Kre6p [[Candida] anglica]